MVQRLREGVPEYNSCSVPFVPAQRHWLKIFRHVQERSRVGQEVGTACAPCRKPDRPPPKRYGRCSLSERRSGIGKTKPNRHKRRKAVPQAQRPQQRDELCPILRAGTHRPVTMVALEDVKAA